MRQLLAVLALSSFAASSSADVTTWIDQGGALGGVLGAPTLTGTGNLASGGTFQLTASNLAPSSLTFTIVGFQSSPVPFLGGTLVPSPDVVLGPFLTSPAGVKTFGKTINEGFPDGIDLYFQFWTSDAASPQGASATNAILAQTTTDVDPGVFPATWINGGPNCGFEPDVQVHAYNQDFYILRQSLCTNFEGPFIYLIFGTDEVLMIDTGAGNVDIAAAVQSTMASWSSATGNPVPDLTIVHTHGHGDHKAGDGQMMNVFPNAALVGTTVSAITNHFGIASWPTDIVPYDLGGRVVDIIPIPGHESTHIAFYDRTTGILVTGDSLYPGRLYVFGAQAQGNWSVYRTSMQRLVDFTSNQPLCWVLGTHIEMTTTPGVDFPLGSTYHPDEHRLQLERKHLIELNDAVQASPTPVMEVHDDFIIFPIG